MPIKKKFYRSITRKEINDQEYEHVLQVWNKFEIKTMKDYRELFNQALFDRTNFKIGGNA